MSGFRTSSSAAGADFLPAALGDSTFGDKTLGDFGDGGFIDAGFGDGGSPFEADEVTTKLCLTLEEDAYCLASVLLLGDAGKRPFGDDSGDGATLPS